MNDVHLSHAMATRSADRGLRTSDSRRNGFGEHSTHVQGADLARSEGHIGHCVAPTHIVHGGGQVRRTGADSPDKEARSAGCGAWDRRDDGGGGGRDEQRGDRSGDPGERGQNAQLYEVGFRFRWRAMTRAGAVRGRGRNPGGDARPAASPRPRGRIQLRAGGPSRCAARR